jgi:hypothetical protein
MTKIKKSTLIKIIVTAILMIAVMCVIFSFSNQNGETSSKSSEAVGEIVVDILGVEVPEGETPSTVPIIFDFNIRKCAHLFLYMMLGITSYLFVHSLFLLRKESKSIDLLYTTLGCLAISFLYACFDELHQSFVGGRSAQWRDVGIDSLGYTITILICTLLFVGVYIIKINKQKKAVVN